MQELTDERSAGSALENYDRFRTECGNKRTTDADRLWIVADKLAEALRTAIGKKGGSYAFQEDEVVIRERPEIERAKAVQSIRKFREDGELAVTYKGTSANPYKDDSSKLIELYADDRGMAYWVDPADDRLVQCGSAVTRLSPEGKRLPVNLLRQAALATVRSQRPDADMGHLHPLEDNRNRSTYFFRWDCFNEPAKESELPPFIQVAYRADGELAAFTDTLDCRH